VSGLFTRLARKARGGDIGAARLLVPTPFEAEAPAVAADVTAELGGAPVTARGPASAAALAAARGSHRERDEQRSDREPRWSSQQAGTVAADRQSAATLVGAASPEAAESGSAPAEAEDGVLVVRNRLETAPVAARPASPHRHEATADATAPAGGVHAEERATSTGALVDVAAPEQRIVAARPASPRRHEAAADATAPARGVHAEERAPEQRIDDPRIAADDLVLADDAPLLGPVPRSRPPARTPRGGDRRDRNQPAAAGGETAEPRPVVRVTIGRIDVRGTPAPASPVRPAPVRHQPLGLDEYLRRRDQPPGGSR